MSRYHLLGWTTLACAFSALVFLWKTPVTRHAVPGADPEPPRNTLRKSHSATNPAHTSAGLPSRQRAFPRPSDRSPRGASKPSSNPADFRISVPEGTPEEVANTARWIDATARKRLQEMTDRYRLTPTQQERVFPILARNLPGYTEQMTVSPAPRFGFADPGLTGAAGPITQRAPESNARNTRNTPLAANGNSGKPGTQHGSRDPGNTVGSSSQTDTRSSDASAKTPNLKNGPRQPGSPGNAPTHASTPATAPAAANPAATSTHGTSAAPAMQEQPPGTSNNHNPESDTPLAPDLPPPTLEDELFALLDPDQQALMMDDALDADRWWHEIIGQLESELNDIISSGLPATPQPDSPSDFEAPDDNLFDLLGN